MIDSSFDKNILRLLFLKFPAFEESIRKDIDEEFQLNPYFTFGSFGSWLSKLTLENSESKIVNDSYSFINSLCELNNRDIDGILQVTFFEHLTDYKITIAISKIKLKNKALLLFEEVLNGPLFNGGSHAK